MILVEKEDEADTTSYRTMPYAKTAGSFSGQRIGGMSQIIPRPDIGGYVVDNMKTNLAF